ncbi:hypothetical protein J6590_020186 [Homalodisca vitripennis]|nr:hypothetical protein J6590_020186 [Homalodisca vitripennis]
MDYRTNLNVFRSVLKSGKSYEALDPAIIQPRRAINQAKLTDVKKLLTAHFGNGWERLENLSFYTKLAEVGRDAEEDDEKSVQTLNWKTHYNSHSVSTRPQPYRRQSVHTDTAANVPSRGRRFRFLRVDVVGISRGRRLHALADADEQTLQRRAHFPPKRVRYHETLVTGRLVEKMVDEPEHIPELGPQGGHRNQRPHSARHGSVRRRNKYLKEMVQRQFP